MGFIHIKDSTEEEKPISHKLVQTKGSEVLQVMMERLSRSFSDDEIVDLLFCMMMMHKFGDDVEEDYQSFLKGFMD